MAAARIVACTAAARFANEPAPPETLDVVRRQRQLLRRAAALCLDPIAEETDDMEGRTTCASGAATSSSPFAAASTAWASSSGGAALLLRHKPEDRMVKKASAAPADAETDKRRRLRSLAFSKGLLQRGEPPAPRTPLAPSAAVARLHGRDVVRRGGQRKSRFLFSFPGLLAPAASGGRLGELADLGTKNPVLYLEFPQGRMKLLGTHVYPKNKYLTLQMTRSAKGVVCEDVFESLVSVDAAAADCDFRGGAGDAIDEATGNKAAKEIAEPPSPKFESDGDASDDSDHKDGDGTQTISGAPSVRQSARNAGKTLKKYTDLSSGGDSSNSDNEIEAPEDSDEKEMESPPVKNESQSEDIKPVDSSARPPSSTKDPLVQATLSSMFKKAEEKKRSTRSPKGSPATKGPAPKKQRASPTAKQPAGIKKASGTRRKQTPKVEEDEIEELSSSSQDNATPVDDDSDEDWAE
ncbi:DNA-binding protein RHL1 [Dichanthelium oligosanthes]|uniref:DNA-binding protein RHL1 n=1 Tax=Dichanthelium oligosanthes TaxID=888268 RepID=A0A1E5VM45_9POAL|nr:DNA-binding protein RHL1 [Dichanthelium oligosanthes]